MNYVKKYSVVAAILFFLIGNYCFATDYTTPTGNISFSTYTDDMYVVHTINTSTSTKPVMINYTVNLEDGCDELYIFSLDASGGNPILIKYLTGSCSGSVSTLLPSGKAKIIFSTDGSVNSDDGFTGTTLTYSIDNSTNTQNGTSYITGDVIVDGKVGVGIPSPREKLDVVGNALISQNLSVGASTSNSDIKIYSVLTKNTGASVYGIYSLANNYGGGNVYGIYSSVSGTAGKKWAGYFTGGDVVVNAGNVGIGTTTPSEKLDINGNILIPGCNNYIRGGAWNYLGTSASDYGYYGMCLRYNNNRWESFHSTLNGMAMRFIGNGIEFITAPANSNPATISTLMSINSNGSVGIGTTTPTSKLEVAATNGSGIRIGKIGEAGNTAVPLGALASQYNIDFSGYRDMSLDQIGARISAIRFNNHEANSALIQNTGLAFYTNPSGHNTGTTDLVERMRILPNGNIGIGCLTPQNALDVKGTIRATEVKVESVANFADFVFEKGYTLPNLTDVSQFIEDNGHLPNIPSAQEVKENGMSLVEMQVKLLQKVEELTLYSIQQQQYSIQQQKEIQSLKAELESLKNK